MRFQGYLDGSHIGYNSQMIVRIISTGLDKIMQVMEKDNSYNLVKEKIITINYNQLWTHFKSEDKHLKDINNKIDNDI